MNPSSVTCPALLVLSVRMPAVKSAEEAESEALYISRSKGTEDSRGKREGWMKGSTYRDTIGSCSRAVSA